MPPPVLAVLPEIVVLNGDRATESRHAATESGRIAGDGTVLEGENAVILYTAARITEIVLFAMETVPPKLIYAAAITRDDAVFDIESAMIRHTPEKRSSA